MKKKLLALFLAAAMVGAAAGCSQNGGSGTSSGGESGASQSSVESQEPSGEVVTVRMGGWSTFDEENEAGTIGMEEGRRYGAGADWSCNFPVEIVEYSYLSIERGYLQCRQL